MSDTPRTDAVKFWFSPDDRTLRKYDGQVVYADFARTLECENNQLRTENSILGPAATNCALVMQERDQLREALEGCMEALKSANVQLKTHIALVENVDKKAVRQRLMFRDVIEQNDEALSHPAVQQILNKKSI